MRIRKLISEWAIFLQYLLYVSILLQIVVWSLKGWSLALKMVDVLQQFIVLFYLIVESWSELTVLLIIIIVKTRTRSILTLMQSWRSVGIPLKLADYNIIPRRISPMLVCSFIARRILISFGRIEPWKRTKHLVVDLFDLV